MFFFKQKTAYEMRISDWSSDVCSSDLDHATGWSSTVSHPARHLIRALPTPLNDRGPLVPTYLLPRRYTLRFDPAALPVLAPIDHVERAIGRAHVCTQVTNAHLVCRLLLEKNTQDTTILTTYSPHTTIIF